MGVDVRAFEEAGNILIGEIGELVPRLKGYRFPCKIVAYAVWADHRFALGTADVEDLLAERGVAVSRETLRKRVNRFGKHFADCIKRDRPAAADKWHLDEVVVPVNGVKVGLWRAVDANGDVLDILVQPRRNAKAARRFLAPPQSHLHRLVPPRKIRCRRPVARVCARNDCLT